jgi:hypothetical protein
MRAVFRPVILEPGGRSVQFFLKAASVVSISKKTGAFGRPLCTDVTL